MTGCAVIHTSVSLTGTVLSTMFPIVLSFLFKTTCFCAAASTFSFFSVSSAAFFARSSVASPLAYANNVSRLLHAKWCTGSQTFFTAPISFWTALILVLTWVASYCAAFCQNNALAWRNPLLTLAMVLVQFDDLVHYLDWSKTLPLGLLDGLWVSTLLGDKVGYIETHDRNLCSVQGGGVCGR